VIRKHACSNAEVFFRLRGAGMVRREGRDVLPRCQLYANYFREYLNIYSDASAKPLHCRRYSAG
jgi:hypothetical protein